MKLRHPAHWRPKRANRLYARSGVPVGHSGGIHEEEFTATLPGRASHRWLGRQVHPAAEPQNLKPITSSVLRRTASRLPWARIAFSRRLPRGASPPALGGRRRGGNPTAIRLPYSESQSIPPTQQCSGLALISPPTDQTRSETNTGKQTERNA